MKIQNDPSRSGLLPESESARPSEILDLPGGVLESTFRQLDESSRIHTALACKHFASLVPQSRRGALLPTRLELFNLGCPRPDCRKILAAFAPLKSGASPKGPEFLRRHYTQAAALQTAKAGKVAGKMKCKFGLYAGYAVNGVHDGFGVGEYINGEHHEGEFKDGQVHGHGVHTWANGERHEGEFKDGRMHGHGVHTWANGERYEGEYKDGRVNGHGVHTWANGKRHEGEFKDGRVNGHGIFTWADGRRYEGEYKDGRVNGHGVYTWADSARYEGEFKDGRMNGHGVYTRANGERHEGEFKDDQANGHGVLTWADGRRYEGEFKDDQANGHGVLTEADGKSCQVVHEHGRLLEDGDSVSAGGHGSQAATKKSLGWLKKFFLRA